MILENIISSNLDLLKQQEEELQKSLELVQEAITFFRSQSGSSIQREKAEIATTKNFRPTDRKTVKGRGSSEGTFISKVMNILKQKNGQTSGDIIQTLFNGQKKEKNRQKFAQNVYVNLSQAKKRGSLKVRDSKFYLA